MHDLQVSAAFGHVGAGGLDLLSSAWIFCISMRACFAFSARFASCSAMIAFASNLSSWATPLTSSNVMPPISSFIGST